MVMDPFRSDAEYQCQTNNHEYEQGYKLQHRSKVLEPPKYLVG